MQDGRPTGVTVLAVLTALAGIPSLAYGIITIIGGFATLLSTADSPALPILVMGVAFLGVAVLYFGVAWALFTLKPWAWLAGVVVGAGAIAVQVVAALAGNVGWPQAIGAAILPAIVLVYLLRPNVRAAFGR